MEQKITKITNYFNSAFDMYYHYHRVHKTESWRVYGLRFEGMTPLRRDWEGRDLNALLDEIILFIDAQSKT